MQAKISSNSPRALKLKDRVIQDYIRNKPKGKCTYRSLQAKYGIDYRAINVWVKDYIKSEMTATLESPEDGFIKEILPILSKYGFTAKFKQKKNSTKITVFQSEVD